MFAKFTLTLSLTAAIAISATSVFAADSTAANPAKPAAKQPSAVGAKKPVTTTSRGGAMHRPGSTATAGAVHKTTSRGGAMHRPGSTATAGAVHKTTSRGGAMHRPGSPATAGAAHKTTSRGGAMHRPGSTATNTAKKPPSTALKVWTTVPSGFELAKKQNKPIVVDFFTDWCGWCKVMERETFEKPEVEHTLTTGYVAVRANAEDGAAGQQLAEKLGINAYPTLMIFDAQGNPKVMMRGFVPPKQFNDVLTKYLAGKMSELGDRATTVGQPADAGAPSTNPSANNAAPPAQNQSVAPGTPATPNTGLQPQTGSPSQ